ncbi:hypothetical protein ACRQ5Q_14755 [Bradyrhizobium sp. PMVTL-01]|uniref:hypothetical protein n=1 Tax=Bradyrhizobium sp. PMVTL-01 TaxID=3434999 RepID=UPI003F71175A
MRNTTKTVKRDWCHGEGKTVAEAKADLEKKVDWACSASALHVEKRFESVLVVAATPTGWTVQLVRPDEMANGSTHHSSCSYGMDKTFDHVLSAARMWAAQNAWSKDVDSDAWFVAELSGLKGQYANDLAGWIRWQRSYNEWIALGKTPAEAHQLASSF